MRGVGATCGERQGDDDDSAFDWVKRPCALEGGGVTRYNGTKFYCKEVNGEGLQREFTRANSANELQR